MKKIKTITPFALAAVTITEIIIMKQMWSIVLWVGYGMYKQDANE